MNIPAPIPFHQLLDALLDVDTPFHPRYLYRLSDLDETELAALEKTWPDVPAWRRQALMEDVEQLGASDTLLSFEALGRFAGQDIDPKVRQAAVRALWEYESPDLISIFLDLLREDSEAEVRAVAATALGRFVYLGELEEIPMSKLREIEDSLLLAITGSDTGPVRRRALEALGYSSREEVDPLIEAAYRSTDKEWKASALFAMGRSANERWEPEVLASLESNLPSLRLEAARAAGELEITGAASLLLDLLEDPDDDVRDAAIWSLSQIGGEGVREALEQMYEETEDESEADFIEEALDNLSFTEDMQLFNLFDLPEGETEQNEPVDLADLEDELFDAFEDDGDQAD